MQKLLSRLHMGLIRRYSPDPGIDWGAADLSAGLIAYRDATVEAEFKRFMYRNLTSLLAAAGSSGALVLYPIVFPGQLPLPFNVLDWCAAVAMASLLVVDAYLLLVDEFTQRKAYLRSLSGVGYGIAAAVGPLPPLATLYARCREGVFFTSDAIGMHPNEANYLHDCVNIISTICILVVAAATMALIEHPATATFFSVVIVGNMYMGFLAPAPTVNLYESAQDIGLKLLIYLMVVLLLVVSAWAKFMRTRRQFENSVHSYAQAALTARRAADVDAMLVAMLPESVLDRLMAGERVSDHSPSATVLFSDMVEFTAWSSVRSCATVVEMLNTLCIEFDRISTIVGVEKVKTIGDAYWAVCGLPEAVATHAERMCVFALRMHQTVRQLSARYASAWGSVRLRIGVNSGPLSGALFGTQRLSYEVFGRTSEIAEQCEKHGVPERVCIGPLTSQMLPPSVEVEAHGTLGTEEGPVPTYLITAAGEAVLEAQKSAYADVETSSRESTRSPMPSLHSPSLPSPSPHSPPLGRAGSDVYRSSHSFTAEQQLGPDGTPRTVRVRSGNFKGKDEENAQRRRRRFIEQRAARQAVLAEHAEDAAEAEARLSQREYRWVLLHFADTAVEARYQAFVREQHLGLFKFIRGFMVALIVVQLVVIFAQGAAVNALSMTLLAVALAGSVGLLAGAFLRLSPLVDALALNCLFLLDIVGCSTLPNSLVGNDPSYLVPLFLAVAVQGTTRLGSAVIIGLIGLSCVAPALYFVWSHLLFLSELLIILTSQVLFLPLALSTEKMYRRQFIEYAMQQHNAALQSRREAEQGALLEAIVPRHIIAPLQRWIHEDHMDPSRTIARVLEHVAVAFVKLRGAGPPSAGDGGDEARWLFEAHARLDEVLGRHPEFDKIKTIGDIVMLAGSFTGRFSCGAAALAMLEALREASQHVDLRAGLHAGEVMGAVLGTARLCFDIFGDSVNTASRVLSTLPPADSVGVSEAFHDAVLSAAGDGESDILIRPFTFSAPVERAAKGKGVILVRRVDLRTGSRPPEGAEE